MATNAPRTAQDLLEVMGENIQRLRDGEATPAVANAIVNSTAGMLRIVKLQMEYAKMTGRNHAGRSTRRSRLRLTLPENAFTTWTPTVESEVPEDLFVSPTAEIIEPALASEADAA